MIEKFVLFSKGVALLAAAAYLLSRHLRQRKKRKPPCETCKHLQCVDVIGGNKKWQCGRNDWLYGQWHDRNLEYCSNYEPRTQDNDDGRGTDATPLTENPEEDVW